MSAGSTYSPVTGGGLPPLPPTGGLPKLPPVQAQAIGSNQSPTTGGLPKLPPMQAQASGAMNPAASTGTPNSSFDLAKLTTNFLNNWVQTQVNNGILTQGNQTRMITKFNECFNTTPPPDAKRAQIKFDAWVDATEKQGHFSLGQGKVIKGALAKALSHCYTSSASAPAAGPASYLFKLAPTNPITYQKAMTQLTLTFWVR